MQVKYIYICIIFHQYIYLFVPLCLYIRIYIRKKLYFALHLVSSYIIVGRYQIFVPPGEESVAHKSKGAMKNCQMQAQHWSDITALSISVASWTARQ